MNTLLMQAPWIVAITVAVTAAVGVYGIVLFAHWIWHLGDTDEQ